MIFIIIFVNDIFKLLKKIIKKLLLLELRLLVEFNC